MHGRSCAVSGREKERLKGGVFEEADLETYSHDLAKVSWGGEVFSTGAEVGEAEVPGAGELEARGDDGCVEVDNGAELNLDAELHGGGREGFAIEYPTSAVCKG